jgi:hypothetical protein
VRDPDRSDDVAEVFDRYSERTVLPITECLIEMTRMSIGPHELMSIGQHVLDIACGSGIVTRRAAIVVDRFAWIDRFRPFTQTDARRRIGSKLMSTIPRAPGSVTRTSSANRGR